MSAVSVTFPTLPLRPYQRPIWNALVVRQTHKRALIIHPRRSGKDLLCLQILACKALQKVGTYGYFFPTFAQISRALWNNVRTVTLADGTTRSGNLIDIIIPPELQRDKNQQDRTITLINGSIIRFAASDDPDKIVGASYEGVVFSEWSLSNPKSWALISPIIAETRGFAYFNGTPRGENHLFDDYQNALRNPDLTFLSKLSLDDTQHIDLQFLDDERRNGMAEEDIQQEYYTSFAAANSGAYYARELSRIEAQIVNEDLYDPEYRVETAWDLGARDGTAIIFFQRVAGQVRIIDSYDAHSHQISDYVGVLNGKPYKYATHWLPHDARAKILGMNKTRVEQIRDGVTSGEVRIVPMHKVADGIQAVRAAIASMWFAREKCLPLLKALRAYQKEFDNVKNTFSDKPLHDWSSHYADAMRYAVMSRDRRSPATPAAATLDFSKPLPLFDEDYEKLISGSWDRGDD